jgi:uncharacterized protein YnzC (UPF0291/DUF896 family)
MAESEPFAVDARGNPVPDPTKNVLDLVEAAIKRQDDLRELTSQHAKEMAVLRAEYQREIREAEADRLDAIRAVDVQAVATSAADAEARATALAATVAASAEAMRNQVAAAATAASVSLAAALEPIQKRIDDLSRAQYEAQGQKVQVTETQAKGSISGMWIGIAIGGFSFFLSMLGLIVAVYIGTH